MLKIWKFFISIVGRQHTSTVSFACCQELTGKAFVHFLLGVCDEFPVDFSVISRLHGDAGPLSIYFAADAGRERSFSACPTWLLRQ